MCRCRFIYFYIMKLSSCIFKIIFSGNQTASHSTPFLYHTMSVSLWNADKSMLINLHQINVFCCIHKHNIYRLPVWSKTLIEVNLFSKMSSFQAKAWSYKPVDDKIICDCHLFFNAILVQLLGSIISRNSLICHPTSKQKS